MRHIILIVVILFNTSLAYVKIGLSKPTNVTDNDFQFDNSTPTSTTSINDTLLDQTTTSKPESSKTTEASIKSVFNYTIPLVFRRPTKSPKIDITTTTETVNLNSVNQLESIIETKSSHYYCECDFLSKICDINCCCDIDCSNEIIKTFNCQFDRGPLEVSDYDNGLQSCRMNEGWLCVFRRNVKFTKKDHYNPNLKVIDSYSWPSQNYLTVNSDNKRNYYKIGETILIYNEELSKVMTFELPFSLFHSYCNIQESIRHLIPEKRNCLISFERSAAIINSLQEILLNSYLLRQPIASDEVDRFSGICSNVNSNCRPINVFRCMQKNKNCYKAEKHSNDSVISIDFNNIVDRIHITITHNFTNLLEASAFIYFREFDDINNDITDEFWQQFEVDFIEMNNTRSDISNVGGPLGYLIGGSIIASKLVDLNGNNFDKIPVIEYFHVMNNLLPRKAFNLMVPISENGYCKKSFRDDHAMKFGENLLIECFVKFDNITIVDHKSNFSKICDIIQETAFEMLFNNPNITNYTEMHVSQLGKPKNSIDFWKPVRLINFENIKISGFASPNDNSFVCQNIIISAKYKFFIEQVEYNEIPFQNIIKDVYIKFEPRVDLQFQYSEEVKIPLSLSTMFYDLTDLSDGVRAPSLSRKICINSIILYLIYFIVLL